MPSLLEALYIPADEIVQPQEPSHANLRGVVTDVTVLYGGFLYVRALFGITNSSTHLAASRDASEKINYRISKANTIDSITTYTNTKGLTVIDAKMQIYGQPAEGEKLIYAPGLDEIAGKLACANEQFATATPLFQTRLVVQDFDPVPDYTRMLTVSPPYADLAS